MRRRRGYQWARGPPWHPRSSGGAPPLEVGLHEGVEVTVEHALHVAGFVLGAQVLHHLVRLQDVAADLAPEADALLLAADAVELVFTRLALEIGEPHLEHRHRLRTVLQLGPLDLARHDDAGRHVGEADRRRRLVDVLTAGPGR